MDNDSILNLAVSTANALTIHSANRDKLFTSDELSALIRQFYELFKELSDDVTPSPR